jgi:hypothetical protein
MYYLVSFAPHAAIYDITRDNGIEDGNHGGPPLQLIFRWLPLDTLAGERIYPAFLRERLSDLPVAIEHIVHIDPRESHSAEHRNVGRRRVAVRAGERYGGAPLGAG